MVRNISRRDVLKGIGATATVGVAGTASARGKPTRARYAAFNVVNLGTEQVQSPGNPQAEAAARIIQEVDPDVLVVNELANNLQEAAVADVPTDRSNIEAFVDNYLSVPQRDDLEGIEYPYTLQPDSNTGVLPEDDYDFNKDGSAGQRPGDAYGFGFYPGQYAFGIASKYPFDEEAIRSFQEFKWADMPDNRIPVAGDDGVSTEDENLYLTEAELDVYRLSSKTHIDVPFDVEGETVHGLFSHPTPSAFDAANNFNGRWNADEVRFFADYVAGADYIYDDSGTQGGLDDDASYVLMGDQNAGPESDRPLDPATEYLLANDDFNSRSLPTSPGGARRGNPQATADFGDFGTPQVDYVLPSPDLGLRSSAVVWPDTGPTEEQEDNDEKPDDAPDDKGDKKRNEDAAKQGLAADVAAASDHRLVWADIDV